MGWSFVGAGQVSRELRGLPDDVDEGAGKRRGWLFNNAANTIGNFSSTSDDNMTVCTDEASDFSAINAYGYLKDTEPDIFHFSAPGLSGSFVFDNTLNIPVVRVIPYQDVKVVIIRDVVPLQILSIDIINNQGIKYHFATGETYTRQAYKKSTVTSTAPFTTGFNFYSNPLSYTGTWYLSSITDPFGASVNYQYNNGYTSLSAEYKTVVNSIGTSIDTVYTVSTTINSAQLTQVNGSLHSVNLIWAGNLISSVEVVENNYAQKKKFNFYYRFVKQASDNTFNPIRKAFLKEIKEESNCQAFPSHQFEYYGVTFSGEDGTTLLPWKDRKAQDYWGYFNNVQSSLVPKVYKNDAAADGQRYITHDKSGYTLLSGANRWTNSSTVHYGSLQKVVYPGGGFGEITWEPSTYNDGDSTNFRGGGVRVKSTRLSDGDADATNDIITQYQYLDASGYSSGKVLYKPSFAYANGSTEVRFDKNQAPDETIFYTRTTVLQTGRGKTVYEYLVPAAYPVITDTDFAASKSKTARANCTGSENFKNGYYIYPFAPNTNWDFERGLPSKISTYNEAGVQLTEKTFTYQRIGNGTVTIKGLKYEPNSSYSTYLFAQYTILAQTDKVTRTEKTKVFDQLNPSASVNEATGYVYKTLGTSPAIVSVLLDSVSTVNSQGDIYTTQYKYAKDFLPVNANDVQTSMINLMDVLDMRGTVVETIQRLKRGAVTTVIGANLTLFGSFGSPSRPLPKQTMAWKSTTAFTPAALSPPNPTASPQTFTYDAKYFPVTYIDSYDDVFNVLSVRDSRKVSTGVHYGYVKMLPVATFNNAKAEETVFTDFESVSTGSLSFSGTNWSSDAWSGKRSLSLASALSLDKTNVTKGAATNYRFSARLKATAGNTLTATAYNGITPVVTVVLTATANNQWQYLEGKMNMASVPASFTLKVTSNATILVDDIAFYPETATMQSTTHDPLNGVLSASDSRGVSAFTEYDNLGRKKYARDMDKNIVQMTEYQYKTQPVESPVAQFTPNLPYNLISTTSVVTFTPNSSCLSGVTYQWLLNDLPAGTGSTFNNGGAPFGFNQDYRLTCIATHPTNGTSSYTVEFNPICTGTLNLSLAGGESATMYECSQNFVRNFTATYNGCAATDVNYQWYYLISGGNYVQFASGPSPTIQFNCLSFFARQSYQIMCVMTGNIPDLSKKRPSSPEFIQVAGSFSITYVNNTPCP